MIGAAAGLRGTPDHGQQQHHDADASTEDGGTGKKKAQVHDDILVNAGGPAGDLDSSRHDKSLAAARALTKLGNGSWRRYATLRRAASSP
jgi:hypothetical protein